MTETKEALATALAEGFNRVTDPDARQEKFTPEDFETHVRFLIPVIESLIALRETEARLDTLLWAQGVSDKIVEACMDFHSADVINDRIVELERQRDALLNREEASYEQAQS